MKHLSIFGLAFSMLVFAGCSDDDDDTDGGGGTGGSGVSGKGGSAGKGGSSGKGGSAGSAGKAGSSATGGAGGSDGAGQAGNGGAEAGGGGTGGALECAGDGTANVSVEISGLPDGVAADVVIGMGSTTSPVNEDETLEDLPAGTYTVEAARVTDDDPIVRTVFDPVVASSSFCLEDGADQTVSAEYVAVPSSNRLWTSNLRGFAAADLGASGAVDPAVVGDAPVGKDVAFDRDGNLWSMGATTAETMLVRIPAANLASSGDNEFDREIDVPEVECLPALNAMAFDYGGDLWLGACGGNVLEIPASELASSGDATSGTVLSNVGDVSDLAFDSDGNLWVATEGKIVRYDAARLDASTTDPADFTITARDSEDSRDLGPTGLAFDNDGNLWGFDFGSNFIFELNVSGLDGTGEATVVSEVSFVIGVTSLLNRGAFDEGGGLWISYATDAIARLSPTQLTVSSGSGAPVTPEVVITSDELDSDLRVALFPAPDNLPLYHTAFFD